MFFQQLRQHHRCGAIEGSPTGDAENWDRAPLRWEIAKDRQIRWRRRVVPLLILRRRATLILILSVGRRGRLILIVSGLCDQITDRLIDVLDVLGVEQSPSEIYLGED